MWGCPVYLPAFGIFSHPSAWRESFFSQVKCKCKVVFRRKNVFENENKENDSI